MSGDHRSGSMRVLVLGERLAGIADAMRSLYQHDNTLHVDGPYPMGDLTDAYRGSFDVAVVPGTRYRVMDEHPGAVFVSVSPSGPREPTPREDDQCFLPDGAIVLDANPRGLVQPGVFLGALERYGLAPGERQ